MLSEVVNTQQQVVAVFRKRCQQFRLKQTCPQGCAGDIESKTIRLRLLNRMISENRTPHQHRQKAYLSHQETILLCTKREGVLQQQQPQTAPEKKCECLIPVLQCLRDTKIQSARCGNDGRSNAESAGEDKLEGESTRCSDIVGCPEKHNQGNGQSDNSDHPCGDDSSVYPGTSNVQSHVVQEAKGGAALGRGIGVIRGSNVAIKIKGGADRTRNGKAQHRRSTQSEE